MKFYKQIIFILIIFLKTETLLSQNNLFNVNNIKLIKKDKISNSVLADQAIKKGFKQLITKILLKEDIDKLLDLEFNSVKKLVTYYQISDLPEETTEGEFVNFSVTFDKNKIHDLFFKNGILYSEISDKELYILPISIKNDEISVFNKNFFYTNWNKVFENDLIEFILPTENIEIIQIINKNKKDLIELNISNLFQEYTNKNLALVLIEENKSKNVKIYIKSKIKRKNILKNLDFKKKLETNNFNEKIIFEIKKELINIVKSVNLIDIRTPSFLNVILKLDKKSNLVVLNSRVKNIDSIENVFVQDFNKDSMNLRIKYLGKLEKIINQLKKENINLQLNNEQWIIKTL